VNWHISIAGQKVCTICFQSVTINSLYMFRALFLSSSGDTVYTAVGVPLRACYVCWQLFARCTICFQSITINLLALGFGI
jgi:hypothetical protein